MKKNCQNCTTLFEITDKDQEFYEKMKVPEPTFCPQCRMQRRMAYRNERALYKRPCDLCNKTIIGAYPENTTFPVYCQVCWWSDNWDPMEYGREYNSTKPFLTQIRELQNTVPRQHVNNISPTGMVNSDYTNCAGELKNCYLVFGAMRDEGCAFCQNINHCKDSLDILYGFNSERCYDCVDIEQCHNLIYSHSCVQCRDSSFLFDCKNCSDCLGCTGLRNKQYYILNQPYSKEEYFKKKEELRLHTRVGRENFKQQYLAQYYDLPRKYYHGQMNKGFSGDYIANVEKTYESFYIKHARNCKFVFWCNNANDVYDYFSWGDMEMSYECVASGYNSYRMLFSHTSWDNNREIEYCDLCMSSSNLFGCVGLRKKSFCILNKQYSEEEYQELRKKIIEDMKTQPYIDKNGNIYVYGEFFPIELSPFPYMDTVAQEHFPLTETEVEQKGYHFQQKDNKEHQITIQKEQLPESIEEVDGVIVDEVIQCFHNGECNELCTKAFRIIAQEFEFYKKMNIPLPDLCPNCRHYQRVKMRNPLKLWHRTCQCAGQQSEKGNYQNTIEHFHGEDRCPNEFETTYSLDGKEIVYCEQCYQSEVV